MTNGVTKTEKKNGFKVRLLPKTGFKMAKKRYSRGGNTILKGIKERQQVV